MADDSGIGPSDAGGAGPHAIARRVAVAEHRQRQATAGARANRVQGDRPAGILLTSIIVIAVLFGTLAIMIYTR